MNPPAHIDRSTRHQGHPGHAIDPMRRRLLFGGTAAFALAGTRTAQAHIDGRTAHVARGLRAVDRHTLNSVSLLRVFGGYFPIPNHFALVPGEPYCRFVNMRGESRNDAYDGFIVASSLEHLSAHASVAAAVRAPIRSSVLRYGLMLELRKHDPPGPGAPPTPSVLIRDSREFVWILGDNAELWPLMLEAYGRLPARAFAADCSRRRQLSLSPSRRQAREEVDRCTARYRAIRIAKQSPARE